MSNEISAWKEIVPEIERMAKGDPLVVKLKPLSLWFLLSAVQLALRHPKFPTPLPGRVREALDQLAAHLLAEYPLMARVWEAGWDPAQDAPRDQPWPGNKQ